ncbi:M24 family metallopeptidase [bacterium]|nr:MAG: M24 family metallopeptidase [bacterium]
MGDAKIPYQTDFPSEEFKVRWEKLFDGIGSGAIAVVQGASMVPGYMLPRQNNEFYYLCGVETPHSYLLLDGRDRRVTLFLPPRNPKLEAAEGKVLSAEDVEEAKRLIGVDDVRPTTAMGENWLAGLDAKVVYALFSPGEGYAVGRHEANAANRMIEADPWDARTTKEAQFVAHIQARTPGVEMRDLTPILDDMRSVKSPREIALIRTASRIAGLAMIEAIRSTQAGLYEYQLEAVARYVFTLHGARTDAYRAIIGAGTENIGNLHYFRNNSLLKDGDLVLMDYAPDYHYYAGDIGRVWPVNGKFDPVARQLLGFILAYHKAVQKEIRPGVTVEEVYERARAAMESTFAATSWLKPAYQEAARTLLDKGGGAMSHPVGMAVHDDGRYADGPLKVGQVFSVDPQLWVRSEGLYLRYEDTGVVTEDGWENFTHFLPVELDDLERLVAEKGMVQHYPPVDLSTL